MKIATWNVNGLKACLEKGFVETIKDIKADVVCLQETKLNEPLEIKHIPYHFYYFCAKRKGYSGTAIFSRLNPLSVKYGIDIEEFDKEGRVITVEYKNFYVVNVYVPNSQNSLARMVYRDKFDIEFRNFIQTLQENKPVILCGDFNVAHKDIDVYVGNERNEGRKFGFTSEERSNFEELLDCGLVDIYRKMNPEEVVYSWWSNRQSNRAKNLGWRIDYILVEEKIADYVVYSKYLDQYLGSDHCPIAINIDSVKIGVDKMTDDELAEEWNKIDWVSFEEELLDSQQKLTKAVFIKNKERVEDLQKRIERALSSRALAVRKVTNSDPTPGIDGVKWKTASEKMRAALLLSSYNYKAQPFRQIVIKSKHNTKERKINIPTMYDRAMQVLYSYIIDPVAEASGDRKSFAFRKGRSLQDVHEYIMKSLSEENAPEYVLLADVKSYYNTICHEWLLAKIPMKKRVLEEFLKAGFVLESSLFPTEEGISLGTSISPILGNMVLDGLQEYIYNNFYGENRVVDYANGNMIRFADDIVLFGRTEQDCNKFCDIITSFLQPRGLKLSMEKTYITKVTDGFDFLARHYQKVNDAIISTPSEYAIARFENELKEMVQDYKGSQKSLIEALNKKLNGFATYHKVTDSSQAFRHIDIALNALLLEECERKHPKLPRKKVISKYWIKVGNKHIYAVPSQTNIQLMQLEDVFLIRHKKIKTSVNPYLDPEYFLDRENARALQNVTGKYKSIWLRQNGKCYYCGREMLPDQPRITVTINQSKPATINNTALVHECCIGSDLEQIYGEYVELLTKDKVLTLLNDLSEYKNKTDNKGNSFDLLNEFFLKEEKSHITLSFEQIELIIGKKLCSSAYKSSSYWTSKKHNTIGRCWLNNGYIIQNLHLDKKYIVFRKDDTTISKLKIPDVLLKQKIPNDAKYEIENFFEYIKKKYGL